MALTSTLLNGAVRYDFDSGLIATNGQALALDGVTRTVVLGTDSLTGDQYTADVTLTSTNGAFGTNALSIIDTGSYSYSQLSIYEGGSVTVEVALNFTTDIEVHANPYSNSAGTFLRSALVSADGMITAGDLAGTTVGTYTQYSAPSGYVDSYGVTVGAPDTGGQGVQSAFGFEGTSFEVTYTTDDAGAGTNPLNHAFGFAWIDNSVVPEPSAATLLILGGVALLAKRKR